jgi:N-acetylglutamate synthase-like GNAT family acetyltransferase
MANFIQIRAYQNADTFTLWQLFYDTIHTVNCNDYTEAQIEAWAPNNFALAQWIKKFSTQLTYVAEIDNLIVGFAQLEASGYIDCFYVHKDFQGQGIGSKLMQKIELKAKSLEIKQLFSEVSITALPFFTRHNFTVVQQQQVERRGQKLTNYRMFKNI